MLSLYIHIPFCLSKCNYCAFPSVVSKKNIYYPYIKALKKELKIYSNLSRDKTVGTLFIGGGTPTVLDMSSLVQLLEFCKNIFTISGEAEISVEANPGTVNKNYLQALRKTGFNRISFGVQSFVDKELQQIGRLHDAATSVKCINLAFGVGFKNISIDLMYGLPGQSCDSWNVSLLQALAMPVQHLSIYQLTLEDGTYLDKWVNEKKIILPKEDEIIKFDEITEKKCLEKKFKRYEISNYAKNGCKCSHNLTYWHNKDYLGVGAAAVSYISGVRKRRVADPGEYISKIENEDCVIVERESLGHEQSFRETVVMGLRLSSGISCQELYNRYGLDVKKYYGEVLTTLLNKGLVEISGANIRITEKGRPYSNIIMSELV